MKVHKQGKKYRKKLLKLLKKDKADFLLKNSSISHGGVFFNSILPKKVAKQIISWNPITQITYKLIVIKKDIVCK